MWQDNIHTDSIMALGLASCAARVIVLGDVAHVVLPEDWF